MSFDLISVDGHRLPWTDAGPRDGKPASGNVVGGGPRSGQLAKAAVVREDDGEVYYLGGNGGQLMWLSQGMDDKPEEIPLPKDLPALSWASGLAWDTQKGVLAIISGGVDGYFYRYDTQQHRWLDAHPQKYRDVTGLTHHAQSGRYIAVSGNAELLFFSEHGELQEVRPLAGSLPDLAGARERGIPILEGLTVAAQGDRVALVNIRGANVTHIWTYELGSRKAQLSYRQAGLPPQPAAASSVASQPSQAPSAPALQDRIRPLATWFEQIMRLREEPSAWAWAWTVTAATEARVLLVTLISLAGLLVVLGISLIRPPRSSRGRALSWLAALALAALLAVMIYAGKPPVRAGLLSPAELWNALKWFYVVLRLHVPLESIFDAFDPVLQYRLMASAACVLLPLALSALLLSPRRPAARILVLVIYLGLAVAPTKMLVSRYAHADLVARETVTGEALFEAKCNSGGAKRVYAVGGIESIRLTGIRNDAASTALLDRDWPEAGIPGDRTGMSYVKTFLDFEYQDQRGNPAWGIPGLPGTVTLMGYRFVDVLQADGSYLRYSLAVGANKGTVDIERISTEQAARYAVNYARNDTPQDRAHWVAGATVTVTDTQTGEVIGELKTFSHVPPLRDGSSDLNVRNWRAARSCPNYGDVPGAMVRMFTEKILQRPPQ